MTHGSAPMARAGGGIVAPMTAETSAPALPEGFPLDPMAARVIGALIEKSMTTPDNYPLSLNAVTTACNQVSNRDPVVEFSETDVATTLRTLTDHGIASLYRKPGDRVIKYVHKLDRALGIGLAECAVLAVLLLRGDQTAGELRQRTERYGTFASLDEVKRTLGELMEILPPLVSQLSLRPGQNEPRFRQLIATATEDTVSTEGADVSHTTTTAPPPADPDHPSAAVRADTDAIGARVSELERKLDALLETLGVTEI